MSQKSSLTQLPQAVPWALTADKTEMAKKLHDQATRDAYHNLIPMRRYGTPEEVADAAVFLASDRARYINGHILNVDGGFLTAGLMFKLKGPVSRTF